MRRKQRIAWIDAGFEEAGVHARQRCRAFFQPLPKTPRGTLLSVPLECCLLGFAIRYFFFAAFLAVFFAAFFAGFLAAFLVAICLFSLFDGLHRVLQIKLQLKKV